jgi:hypothetical protein
VSTGTAAQTLTTAATKNGPLRPAWVFWVSSGLLAVSVVALCTSIIVATYNVRYSYARISTIMHAGPEAATEPEATLAAIGVPGWVSPFLQDLSVVSPSLVAFTCLCMVVGAALLIWFPMAAIRMSSVHFPFPGSYKTYFIQLGLLGTIIGFVIAFSDVDPRAEGQSLVLVEALGTALWSTLTAILLAYGACPVVEMLYQRIRRPGLVAAPDTRSALQILRERTVDAADSLASLQESARALGQELSVHHLERRVGRLEDNLSQAADHMEELTRTARALRDRQEELDHGTRTTESWIGMADERLGRIEAQIGELGQTVGNIVSAVEELRSWAARLQEEDIPTQSERLGALEQRLNAIVHALKQTLE